MCGQAIVSCTFTANSKNHGHVSVPNIPFLWRRNPAPRRLPGMNVVSSRVNHPVFFKGHGSYKASKLGGFTALGLPVITINFIYSIISICLFTLDPPVPSTPCNRRHLKFPRRRKSRTGPGNFLETGGRPWSHRNSGVYVTSGNEAGDIMRKFTRIVILGYFMEITI